ncbi:DUF4178 domain-containing protein [Corynebacterium felinum]|uniref:DUF4178 domain-containing protein n=1 Tax=Corynebacterium felinum TaxID=131318 RepID=A0ABU2B8A8_9CORY|nr:DUF4178 domain-containing protein [Corynebacterium felinum]MDF5820210.1 DUF4178 domain-containing protein [Corynebacterium felinum]MDR7354849.1 hypothetical protein [Corynebacterium felinum]WJY94209.1 hypothetical protein CFELI_02835 [Corynebacterium felinum]
MFWVSFLALLALVLLGVGVGLIVRAYKIWQASKNPPSTTPVDPFAFVTGAERFSTTVIGPGAVISHGSTDYVVRGTLTCRQGPFEWYEHLLTSNKGPGWFEVEVDEGEVKLALWRTDRSADLSPLGQVTYEGETYTEVERGPATYTSVGTTGLPMAGEMTYVDYKGPDGKLLSLEKYSDDSLWEVSIGHEVVPGELTIYPAPPAQEYS